MSITPTLSHSLGVVIPYRHDLVTSRRQEVFAFLVAGMGFEGHENVRASPANRNVFFRREFEYDLHDEEAEARVSSEILGAVRELREFPELIPFASLRSFFSAPGQDAEFCLPIAALEVMQLLEQEELSIGVWLEPPEEDDAECLGFDWATGLGAASGLLAAGFVQLGHSGTAPQR